VCVRASSCKLSSVSFTSTKLIFNLITVLLTAYNCSKIRRLLWSSFSSSDLRPALRKKLLMLVSVVMD
jgi:hypothetical protein